MRPSYRFSLTMILALTLIMAGCSSKSAATTSSPGTTTTAPTTTVAPTTTTTTPPSSTAATYQSLAALGQTVFTSTCAVCHGTSGQGGVGPALWGSGVTYGTYAGASIFATNAQAMLDFVTAKMPFTAPGSLTSTQYLDVTCYILVQANLVTPSNAFDQSQLASITLP